MAEEQITLDSIGPSEALIEVRQLPIITERLRQVKEQVEEMTTAAASLICNADTVQTVKQTRADLRKQFEELENQRKAVKAAVMGPYESFVKVYEECIKGPFTIADNKLKEQIDSFEKELKNAVIDRLRTYHAELCAAHGIDWLTFEKTMQKAGIKISMADANAKTPKKPMNDIAAFVSDIACGVDTINKLDNADEVMVEFKKTLNATEAIGIVAERKKALEQEKADAERRAEEAKAREEKLAQAARITQPITGPEIVSRPVIEAQADEKIYTIRFTVRTTREKALRLKAFMIKEEIEYGNE